MYSVIGTDGQVYGPANMDTLYQWCREGRIESNTNMIDPLDGRVMRARDVPGLDEYFASVAAPPMPPQRLAEPIQGYPYGQASAPLNPYTQPPNPYLYPPTPQSSPRSKTAAILLAFFLGCFGAHRFYLGHTGSAVAMMLLTILTCGYGGIITGIWAIVDLILIAAGTLRDVNDQPLY